MAAFPIGASLLDAIVLAIVQRTGSEGTYGYRITQDVRQVMELSESTLYPVLRRLLKDGYLDSYDRACAGRNRRYYRITAAGHAQLASYLQDWVIYRNHIEAVFFDKPKKDDRLGEREVHDKG